jgi:biotin carboxylase
MSPFNLLEFLKRKKPGPARLFVSIGMGENQLPLIAQARALGFRVIGVDRNTKAFAAVHCDLKIQESIDSHAEILAHLEEISVYGDIRGVLSKSYGAAVRTACHIANSLGFPMFPWERMDDFIVKTRMKAVFEREGIPSPAYMIMDPSRAGHLKAAKLLFPMVVKPVTGHAKTGVRLVENRRDLQHFIRSLPARGTEFIAEEHVAGDEVIALGIVHGGVFHLAALTDKRTTPAPYFVDLLHITPSVHHGLWGDVKAVGQRIANAFQIQVSPLVIEMIVTAGGGIRVIEAVPEFGGEFLPDCLVPHATGYNLIEQAIRAATGMPFTPPPERVPRSAVAVRYLCAGKGRLVSINPKAAQGMPGVILARAFKPVGAEVGPPANNHERVGVVIAKGRTRDAALDASSRAEAACAVTVSGEASGQ